MADKWAVASGNWSNPATWNGGVKPGVSDDVYADGYTVTIDEDVTVASVRTTQRSGGTAGGGFVLAAGCSLVANLHYGTTNCVTASYATPGESSVAGTLYPSLTQYRACIYFSGSGRLNFIGVPQGGIINETRGIEHAGNGELVVTGDVTGNAAQVDPGGDPIRITGSGSTTIIGDVAGAGISRGVYSTGTGAITITGSVVPGTTGAGLVATRAIHLSITGEVYGGSSASGVYAPSATVHHDGTLVTAANGRLAVVCASLLTHATNPQIHTYRVDAGGVAGEARSLYTGGTNLGQPSASDVRYGTTFGVSSEYTGTCHVPGAASVLSGVPVDATVGTAILTAALVRAAVGLAEANLDAQFAAITVDPQSIRDAMKLAPSAGAAAAGSIDDQLATKPSTAAVGALLAAALDAP